MENLNIALLQPDLAWENTSANLTKLEAMFKQVGPVDLVFLPEMFNTGFSMNVKDLAQSMNGKVVNWMKEQALENNFGMVGSTIIENNQQVFNRLIMAYPCASVKYYDKRHLFRMGEEDKQFSKGTKSKVFNYYGWRIKTLICYDLRFPVWSRNRNDYDLLVYVANWPGSRNEVWKTLLKARAIENQCYVVGVNRVGTDGTGITYSGNSMVIDPKGTIISSLEPNEEGICKATLSLPDLQIFREKFPVHLDADEFELQV